MRSGLTLIKNERNLDWIPLVSVSYWLKVIGDKDPLHVTEYFPELHSSSCSSRLEGIRTKHGCQNELIINENINGHLIIYIFVSLNHNQLKQIYFTWKWFFFCSDGGREKNSVELPVNPLVNCHIYKSKKEIGNQSFWGFSIDLLTFFCLKCHTFFIAFLKCGLYMVLLSGVTVILNSLNSFVFKVAHPPYKGW